MPLGPPMRWSSEVTGTDCSSNVRVIVPGVVETRQGRDHVLSLDLNGMLQRSRVRILQKSLISCIRRRAGHHAASGAPPGRGGVRGPPRGSEPTRPHAAPLDPTSTRHPFITPPHCAERRRRDTTARRPQAEFGTIRPVCHRGHHCPHIGKKMIQYAAILKNG